METPNKVAIGVVGNGTVTDANAAGLLDNFIPDKLSGVYTTQRVTRSQTGLRAALQWFSEEGLEVTRTDKLLDDLLAHKAAGHDVWLIVVGCDGSEGLIANAQDAGVTVKDLTAALDDVLPAAPETETEATDPAEEAPPTLPSQPGAFTADEVRVLKMLASGLLAGAATPPVADAPSPARGSADRREGTKPYYVNEDGAYRAARGLKKADETKVFLTPEEVEALVLPF